MDKKKAEPKDHEIRNFILRTLLYFVVFFLLMYLYSYVGVNGSHFIYNEF
ncbi:teichoic acid D-Ala incorporation-associated protein DltX [Lapidilactobacillus mulanensis]|uniref:Teichoic acid D-Ala incorporation-associated protein DltX n=1 Tax=Lapidilactobacillus mulanensis TaxID=2485999 RepID=A0ABW4DK52_9LACO|nr:teichoic acid D-Ala incorporation-associated protein DltX [Lapidilactobacillus mulanensis]